MISRKSTALRVQVSACGYGERKPHPYLWLYSISCDSKIDTAEKRGPLGIMMTFKSYKVRKPGKVRY